MRFASRYPPAFVASALMHAAAACLILMAAHALPDRNARRASAGKAERAPRVVWLADREAASGPLRGGGGGGGPTGDPARRLERRGQDPRSTPTSRPVVLAPAVPEESPTHQRLDLPVVPMALGLEELPGASVGLPVTLTESRGLGGGDGAGGGVGDGLDGGRGPGLGLGGGGSTGGGVRQPGGAVSDPVLVHSIRPRYTEQAMRARLQGVVEMDAVVLRDGRVGAVRIVRSLDRSFGLDANAIDAVKEWRFKPGLFAGEPVAVLVRVELTFSLR